VTNDAPNVCLPGEDAGLTVPSACKSRTLIRRLILASVLSTIACSGSNEGKTPNAVTSPKPRIAEPEKIIERYRNLDLGNNSSANMKVTIREESGSTREVRFTMHRRRDADGRQFMLIEFTFPTEERDRSSLITISPNGEVEATRYAQSTNSFVTARGATTEDSLFGMTLQELAEGQPEKYNFTVVDEAESKLGPGYRLEGKLKEAEDSKFPRVVVVISKETSATLQAEFYDRQDKLVRRMESNAIEVISGHPARTRFTVDNLGRQKKLDFEALSIAFDQKFNDSFFTTERLKRVSVK
jgi:hypothetical protein